MDRFYIAVTADDVGMGGYSTPEHLTALTRLWESEELRGTLFVVPRWDGCDIGQSAEYVSLLKAAIARGHEVAQHGLDHERFQTGIPPGMVLDLPHEGPARKYLAECRDQIEAMLTPTHLRQVLTTGRNILEDALGERIQGFRAPCLSTCNALFDSLAAGDYRYDSSKVFQDVAWELIVDPSAPVTPHPITCDRLLSMQTGGRMWEWPISAEYTWYLRRECAHTFLDLAKHDFDACLAAGVPFVPVCHVSPVQEGDPDCGFDLYRRLLDYARMRTAAEGKELISVTLSTLCDRWECNEQ